MLKGIQALGKVALTKAPFAEALVDLELSSDGGKTRKPVDQSLIVTLNIRLDSPRVEVDLRELSEKALVEVLWVGNAAGSNSPQDRFTTNHPEYLVSQTVPNLLENANCKKAFPEGSDLVKKLQTLRDTVFIDLGEKSELFLGASSERQYERYRWVWDLLKLGVDQDIVRLLPEREREEVETICSQEGVSFLTRDFLQAYARAKGRARATAELVGKVLETWVAAKMNVKTSQLKLYTLALNGELLSRHPDYISYLEHKLVDEVFAGDQATEGVCHICGSKGMVTADTTRFKLLKFYITDKPGFASRLHDKGFLRNYALCKECYRALLAGERFVENELRTRLGQSNVYLIPTFQTPEAYPDAETIEEWAQYLKARLAAAETLENWHAFQRELEKYRRYEKQEALFVLNFLFATKERAAVKVDKLIAEVPPSRLDQLNEVRNSVRNRASKILGADAQGEWDLGLGKLFYLLPLKQTNRGPQAKPYLELLETLLVGRSLTLGMLIPHFLETACVHRFERYEAYVHERPDDPERALVLHLLRTQLFLHYLRELGQLWGLEKKGGEQKAMTEEIGEAEKTLMDQHLRTWLDGLGLKGAQRGLFLLGVLIGKIGSLREQRESGKPILNKVHFQGMDREKIMRLANEVYEKLRQYKIAEYNEGLYAMMKAQLDSSLNELGSPHENVYWVLSGYAYATWQAIHAGAGRRAEGSGQEEVH